MNTSSQRRAAEELREATRGIACGRIITEHAIRTARTRPAGCSAARWRIELRRRAKAGELRNVSALARRIVVYPGTVPGKEAF